MGVTRKLLSLGTIGLVDFRSDKERIAMYTKQTRDVIRPIPRGLDGVLGDLSPGALATPHRKTGLDARLAAKIGPKSAAAGPVGGWYPDNLDPSQDRWWTGAEWTATTRAAATDAVEAPRQVAVGADVIVSPDGQHVLVEGRWIPKSSWDEGMPATAPESPGNAS